MATEIIIPEAVASRNVRLRNMDSGITGVLIASTGSGALVSRYGRYKAYPLVGAVLVVIGTRSAPRAPGSG
jgi:hypothetical protein